MCVTNKGCMAGRVPGPIGIHRAPGGSDWERIHHYKYPRKRKLQCCFFWTSNTSGNINVAYYAARADQLLREHNLTLDICPGVNKTPESTLNFNERVNASNEEELRELAHRQHYHEGRIPVIFCTFDGPIGAHSDTLGYSASLKNWLPFILINTEKNSSDGVTLLHEIGHAANCEHMNSSQDDVYPNFMSYHPNRTGILRAQVMKLARSYFARDA